MKRRLILSDREHEFLLDLVGKDDFKLENFRDTGFPDDCMRQNARTCRRILNKLKRMSQPKEVYA